MKTALRLYMLALIASGAVGVLIARVHLAFIGN